MAGRRALHPLIEDHAAILDFPTCIDRLEELFKLRNASIQPGHVHMMKRKIIECNEMVNVRIRPRLLELLSLSDTSTDSGAEEDAPADPLPADAPPDPLLADVPPADAGPAPPAGHPNLPEPPGNLQPAEPLIRGTVTYNNFVEQYFEDVRNLFTPTDPDTIETYYGDLINAKCAFNHVLYVCRVVRGRDLNHVLTGADL